MRRIIVLLIFTGSLGIAFAQPFAADIERFRKKDSISFPARNAIVFIGSSSFTMWTDVQDFFPGYTIINRGFGGSSLPDLIRYINEIAIRYQPRQVVIYCGENDIATNDTTTAEMVALRFSQLFLQIRKALPRTSIVFVSIKPSPSRQIHHNAFRQANALIRKFLKKRKRTGYVDVYSSMIDDEGRPLTDLFLEDMLHMNRNGYAIWQKHIQPYLIK